MWAWLVGEGAWLEIEWAGLNGSRGVVSCWGYLRSQLGERGMGGAGLGEVGGACGEWAGLMGLTTNGGCGRVGFLKGRRGLRKGAWFVGNGAWLREGAGLKGS